MGPPLTPAEGVAAVGTQDPSSKFHVPGTFRSAALAPAVR